MQFSEYHDVYSQYSNLKVVAVLKSVLLYIRTYQLYRQVNGSSFSKGAVSCADTEALCCWVLHRTFTGFPGPNRKHL